MRKTQFQTNKLVMLVTVTCFLFSLFGFFAPVEVLAAKAKDKPEQTVGYVNRQQIFASYPDIQDLMNRIQIMRNEAQKDYDANAKDLPAAEKKAYSDKLTRQQAQREDEIMKPVGEKIEASIKAVAEEKGLTVIIDASTVVYGGIDITADVIAKVKQ